MRNLFYIFLFIITSCGQKDNLDQKSTNTDSINTKIELSALSIDSATTSEKSSEFSAFQGNNKIKNFPPENLKQFDFSSIESKISDNLKLDLLLRLIFTEYLLPTKFETNDSYDFENYHVLDFNADGHLDIIYDGRNPMGIETNNVVFFQSQGDSLRPVIKLNGDFTSIELIENQLKSFQLIKSPCCAQYIYRIKNYEFNNSSECFVPKNGNHENYKYSYGQINDPQFCVSLTSQYAYVMRTEFPSKIKLKNSSINSKKAYLTPKPTEPSSTDFEEDAILFHHTENKAISEIPIGTTCSVLSEKTIEDGNTYCFIEFILDNENRNYMNGIQFKQYGWVNKKKLN